MSATSVPDALQKLHDSIAAAVRERVRLRLGPIALELARQGEPVELSTAEADLIADIAASLVEDEAIDRMAEHFVNETNIRSMDFRNGMSMELEPARALAANWVGAARAMLGDAPNYCETPIEMTTSLAGEVEEFVFILQRAGKLTPHTARLLAEERADETEAELAQQIEATRQVDDLRMAEIKRRRLTAERLAMRLASHAFCDVHPESTPAEDCANCGDRSAYFAYLDADGRDFR